jgi:hypothetical protein
MGKEAMRAGARARPRARGSASVRPEARVESVWASPRGDAESSLRSLWRGWDGRGHDRRDGAVEVGAEQVLPSCSGLRRRSRGG